MSELWKDESVEQMVDSVQAAFQARDAWQKRSLGDNPKRRDEALTKYLAEYVPFYQKLGTDLSDGLPLVGRVQYQGGGEEFRSAAFDESQLRYVLASSGTTSVPLSIKLDDAGWFAVNQHFFEQIRKISHLPNQVFVRGEVAVLFVSNKPGRHAFVHPLATLNNGLYVRLQLPASDQEGELVQLYSRFRAPILYGKPTYLLDLRAALIRSGAIRPPWFPRLVLVSGEPLHRDDKHCLMDYFDAPVIDALASTEGGLIAATPPNSETYTVFGENVRLEVLCEDGIVRPSGSGELILTNFAYRGTVFARYRTGDYAELKTDDTDMSDSAQSLVRLLGREPELLRFRSGTTQAIRFTEKLGCIHDIGDFQLAIKNQGSNLLRWVPDVLCTDPATVESDIRHAVRELIPDEHVEFERCTRITPLGGKKRRYLHAETW